MKKRTIILISSLMGLLLTACELRPIYQEGLSTRDVVVSIDWTQYGGTPEGATIIFYPLATTGDSPYTFHTNSVNRTIVHVPSGDYTVMAFNRTVDEYGSLYFRYMDEPGMAQCLLYDKYFSWPMWSLTTRTVYEPEQIVVGKEGFFHVRTLSEATVSTKAALETDSIRIIVERMVMTANVSVRVNGIHNVKAVKSYLTGMAGGAYLYTRSATDTLATHVIEKWSIERDASDYTKGYLTSSFQCFGLPEQYKANQEAQNNTLNMKILLVDNSTTMDFNFLVGDRIKEYAEELTLDLTVGVNAVPGDTAIVLPDVKPEGGGASGFDVTIDEWGDPTDVYIPL